MTEAPVVHEQDVNIHGGVVTGPRSALQIDRAGISCSAIPRVYPLRSPSVTAQGGMNASLMNVPGQGGGREIKNNRGEWKMARYAPHSIEDTPRGVVGRSIIIVIAERRGFEVGCVHPGIRQPPMDIAGVDPIPDPIPIPPGRHHPMGGIDPGIGGGSALRGLSAAGAYRCANEFHATCQKICAEDLPPDRAIGQARQEPTQIKRSVHEDTGADAEGKGSGGGR